MEAGEVVAVGVPQIHYLAADERHVEVAGVFALRVEWLAVFVTLVGDDAAAQDDAGAGRKTLLEFAVESDKETFVAAERERQNARANLVLAHFVSIFWHKRALGCV